jgi:hypothetical protein
VFRHREEEDQEAEKEETTSSKGNREKDRQGRFWSDDRPHQHIEEWQQEQATREGKEQSRKKEGRR